MRTTVGYAGGSTANPTYHNLGDHTESLQVEFDPTVVSYEELLAIFWNSHNPAGRPWSTQYKAAVFCHDRKQKELALKTRRSIEEKTGQTVFTEILDAPNFCRAEDYHQKYYLRQHSSVVRELNMIFPTSRELMDSTLAARFNGLLAGYGNAETIRAEISHSNLPGASKEKLEQILESLRQ